MPAQGAADRKIKAAERHLVAACGGGEGAAATIRAETGVSVRQQRMSDCGNPETPDHLRINEVFYLEAVAERDAAWPPVTRLIAEHHGFLLIPRPQAPAGSRDWIGGMGALAKEAGDVTQSIATALADGQGVNKREGGCIIKDIDEAVLVLLALRELASASIDAGDLR